MMIEPVQLEGVRVTLMPMKEEHAEALFRARQDPQIQALPFWPQFATVEKMLNYIRAAYDEREAGIALPFVIWDKQYSEIVGTTRLCHITPVHRTLEIGFTWHHSKVWRTRVNTECKYLLLKHSFEQLGCVRVQLQTDLRNLRSQAAIERLGAKKEGVLRNHRILHDGYKRDSVIFSIIDEEWPQVKTRLENFLSR